MNVIKKTNKLPVEDTFMVYTGDQASATGALVTTGVNFNILNGQFGVMSYDPNSSVQPIGDFLVSGDDSAEVQAIRVVQGTPLSATTQLVSPWEEGHKGLVESGTIRRNQILSVAVKKADFGQWGGQAVSGFTAPTGDLIYGAYLTIDSTRIDKSYSRNDNTTYAAAPVQNFAGAGITQPLDYVLQHIATQFNSQSKAISRSGTGNRGSKNFVVLGVKIAGGSGQALGTITPTTNVAFDTRNGVTQRITFGFDGISTLADLVQRDANLTVTSTIEVLNSLTAGTAATVDALIILGLPHAPFAAYDDVLQSQVTPRFELTPNFLSGVDPLKTTAPAKEVVNSGRQMLSNWRQRASLMIHTMQTLPHDDYFLEGISYINLAKNYTTYIIEFFDTETTLTGFESGQKKLTMLFPCEVSSAFTPTVANIATRLGTPGNAPYPMVTSNDAGTGTASANTVTAVNAILSAWLEHSRTTGASFKVTGDAVAGGTYLS